QEAEAQKTSPLTVTILRQPYNFALTRLDYGTLLFPQVDAIDPKRKIAVHCLEKNVRSSLMVTLALYHFYRQSAGAAAGPPLSTLRSRVLPALRTLPPPYKTGVLADFYRVHAGLSSIASRDDATQGGAEAAPPQTAQP